LIEGNVTHLEHAAFHTEVIGAHYESVGVASEKVGMKDHVGAIYMMTFGLIKM
jgi:hypothetical protein